MASKKLKSMKNEDKTYSSRDSPEPWTSRDSSLVVPSDEPSTSRNKSPRKSARQDLVRTKKVISTRDIKSENIDLLPQSDFVEGRDSSDMEWLREEDNEEDDEFLNVCQPICEIRTGDVPPIEKPLEKRYPCVTNHNPRHFTRVDSRNRKMSLRCKVCKKKSTIYCPACPEFTALCLGECFANFHVGKTTNVFY